MKLHLREANTQFDKMELYSYMQDCIEDALESVSGSELSVNMLKSKVPGYDPDWCSTDWTSENDKKYQTLVQDLTNLFYDMALANRKEGNTNESLTEAMKVTNSKTYQTEFGPFVITTQEGKARRRNQATGKVEWREIRSTGGVFKDYPDAVEYFVTNDHGDRYVSCSQGNNSSAWKDSLGVSTWNEALDLVNDAVVECFQDYYDDKSLY